MRIAGLERRSIWVDRGDAAPCIIDQTFLPHRLEVRRLVDLEAAAEAIESMRVRGAPLIGATAAHGLALALARDPSDEALSAARERLVATRPTAINLRWAIDRILDLVLPLALPDRAARALLEAQRICEEDVATCEAIGEHGLDLLRALLSQRAVAGRPVTPESPLNLLTHCNAGWLATVDWGTALAPVYKAHAAGIPVHVWVDETRPRNQGASLTAFELREMGVAHTVIVDNAGGHLMQRGRVDAVIVGSDRTTATGDVCNKIGTYLKALAARDNAIPFYVALPSSTIDWTIEDGLKEIPIEERDSSEVRSVVGWAAPGRIESVQLFSDRSPAANPAFDVTPSSLVTRLVTEHGIFEASSEDLARLKRILEL